MLFVFLTFVVSTYLAGASSNHQDLEMHPCLKVVPHVSMAQQEETETHTSCRSSDSEEEFSRDYDYDDDSDSDYGDDVVNLDLEYPLPEDYPTSYKKNANGFPILCTIERSKGNGHANIAALNDEQARLFFATQAPDINYVICSGPAGCGKTYLIAAYALHALATKTVSQIIVTRPICCTGENIGYLPGTAEEKFEPYARPILDAMCAIAGSTRIDTLQQEEKIVMMPISLMRGQNYRDKFVFLDEAQNASLADMMLFFSRLQTGFGGKIVMSGDTQQSDICDKDTNGLSASLAVLPERATQHTAVISFSHQHIVRHHAIRALIKALDTPAHQKDHDLWHKTHLSTTDEKKISEHDAEQHTLTFEKAVIKPYSISQKNILPSLQKNLITFVVGMSGCGKTYYATACALHMLLSEQVSRVFFAKPYANSVNDALGFLPGSVQQKLEPHLQHISEILTEILGKEKRDELLRKKKIQFIAVEFMRGHEFKDCVVLIDEAQNATLDQFRMLLTRPGKNSHMVFTGHPWQIDLVPATRSGFEETMCRLRHTPEVGHIFFKRSENVRNPDMSYILEGYKQFERDARSRTKPAHARKHK